MAKVHIVENGFFNVELKPLLLQVRLKLRDIADIFVEENVDEAEAAIFVSRMLLSEIEKSTNRKAREIEMASGN